ncbi:MAG: N-glycosylase/DNA lyase [Candidatus Pacearchaeota archaeon]
MKTGLINEVKELMKNKVSIEVDRRIKEFEKFENKSEEEWFSELCFCILTANSKADTAIKIQQEIGSRFLDKSKENIRKIIKKNKHRFHNKKADFICKAKKFTNIKKIIQEKNDFEAREWLVKNVKGLGYKEASHFLRNVGRKNIAILDRHILSVLHKYDTINEIPKTLTKKRYLYIEKKFIEISKKLGISAAELDLYLWYMKTGKVLK